MMRSQLNHFINMADLNTPSDKHQKARVPFTTAACVVVHACPLHKHMLNKYCNQCKVKNPLGCVWKARKSKENKKDSSFRLKVFSITKKRFRKPRPVHRRSTRDSHHTMLFFRARKRSSATVERTRTTPCQQHTIPEKVLMIDEVKAYSSTEYGQYAYHSHMRYFHMEHESVPRARFYENLGVHAKIKRARVVNWFVRIERKLGLRNDTVFIALSIFDRFVSRKIIEEGEYMLIGVTSMFIACKYEEEVWIEAQRLVESCNTACSKEAVIIMEWDILTSLDFKLTLPTPLTFTRRFLIIGKDVFGEELNEYSCLSLYLVHLTMMCPEISSQKPSLIAASVFDMCGSVACVGYKWNESVRHYCGGWTKDDMGWIQERLGNLVKNHGNIDGNNGFFEMFYLFSAEFYFRVAKLARKKLICEYSVHNKIPLRS